MAAGGATAKYYSTIGLFDLGRFSVTNGFDDYQILGRSIGCGIS